MAGNTQDSYLAYNGRISPVERISYGLGDVGANLVWATLSSFMTFFFTDIAGIGAMYIGTIFLVSRLLDSCSDVAMGIIVDRTNSRYGKARPWLLWVAIPYGIGAVLLFSVPNFGPTGKLIYAFITYNLMTTVLYTMFSQPYHTLMALMTKDQYERSLLTILRMLLGTVTAILINNITLPMVNFFGGGAGGWQKTMMVYGACAAIIILIVFFNTRERTTVEKADSAKAEKASISVMLKALFSNKYWIMVLFIGVFVYILFALPGVYIYYATYVLGDAMHLGTMMTMNFLPTIIGLTVLPMLLKKIDKRTLVFIGFFFYVLGTVVIILDPSNLYHVLAGIFIKGIGFAPIAGTLYVFVADTIEYGEWKTGTRFEGLYMSAASFGQKMGTGIGLAIISWTLGLTNYVPNAVTQAASALTGIRFMFIELPLIIYALIVLILCFYKLEQEYPKIMAELNARRA